MDLDYGVLVNKDNMLAKDYVPMRLLITDENENNFHQYNDSSLKPMIRSDIVLFVEKMFLDARREGIYLLVDSGYRSYEYQEGLLAANIEKKGNDAYKTVALPGASEHQTGLAIDIACFRNGIYSDDIKEEDVEAKWMFHNSYKYGFILRYPKGKEDITGFSFEPWHYRFVGLELATTLYFENMTLEEYYARGRVR